MVKDQRHHQILVVSHQSVKLLSHGGEAQHPPGSPAYSWPKHPLPSGPGCPQKKPQAPITRPNISGFVPAQACALAKGRGPTGEVRRRGQLRTTRPTAGRPAGSRGSPRAAPGQGRWPRRARQGFPRLHPGPPPAQPLGAPGGGVAGPPRPQPPTTAAARWGHLGVRGRAAPGRRERGPGPRAPGPRRGARERVAPGSVSRPRLHAPPPPPAPQSLCSGGVQPRDVPFRPPQPPARGRVPPPAPAASLL